MKVKNKFAAEDHTFAVCAYKESPFLEKCIESLLAQTVKSRVIISTSTPNSRISDIAEKYSLDVCINTGKKGISGDWDFAISCVNTALVTLAHQDDIYEPNYIENMLDYMNKAENPILFSCAYSEMRDGEKVTLNRLLSIKRILAFPMRVFPDSIAFRRFGLSFGNCICCPSVTYVTDIMKEHPFESELKSNLDWLQWEKLSRLKGSFLYSPQKLMCHRIHSDSETSRILINNMRYSEDLIVFQKFWPDNIAKLFAKIYSASEKSNF